MVALSGAGWRLAPSLVALVAETDRLYPDRSTASDGSLGDAAHAARASDHNPDATGDVLAVDITDDDAHGCDCSLLVAAIRARRDPRVKYVIHRGTITKSYASRGVPAWQPQPYTGPNAHEKHAHVSVLDTPAAKGDTSPWWPQAAPPQEDDEMTDADRKWVADQIKASEDRQNQWIREELVRVTKSLTDEIRNGPKVGG